MPDSYLSFSTFFKSNQNIFDAVLLDIDGTLAVSGTPLPGAIELLDLLNSTKFPYFLLTNDSGRSHAEKAQTLTDAGLPVTDKQILSAGTALKFWAKKNYTGGKFFQYGNWGSPSYAEEAGIEVELDPEKINECCGILAGEGIFEWRLPLEAAFNLLLHHPEYPFIVGNPDGYWPSRRKAGFGIGSGGLARMIVQVLQNAGKTVEPVYLGKPYPLIYQSLFPVLERDFPGRKFSSSRIVMVGDSLESDIAGAKKNGFANALVLSGVTGADMINNIPENKKPDWIFVGV